MPPRRAIKLKGRMVEIPEESLTPIRIGGLRGRLLRLPSRGTKSRDILLIYGLHSSLERMYSTALFHSRYGNVWAPDLPGFGGMDSFYTIGREPDLESYADYLYTFMRTYKLDEKKELRVVAMSFGFIAFTRMLQKYPQMRRNIRFVISFVGFGRAADFTFFLLRNPFSRIAIKLGATRSAGWTLKNLVFKKPILRAMFGFLRLFNPKYQIRDKQQRRDSTDMELDLWTKNDARTKFYTWDLLTDFDLTRNQEPLDIKLYDIATPNDQYVDRKVVDKTLAKLYADSTTYIMDMKLHAPSVIGDEEEVADFYPAQVKKALRS
jgi:pimeloyl-ACP methyl ester carboxylesterase